MTQRLDCRGLMCPMPIVRISRAMKTLAPGETLEVTAADPSFEPDVRAWCEKTKQPLRELNHRGDEIVAVIQKL